MSIISTTTTIVLNIKHVTSTLLSRTVLALVSLNKSKDVPVKLTLEKLDCDT
jgi:hypothetical protein